MKKLNCSTTNCEYNVKSQCKASVITVGDTAKCLSKVKREGGVLAQAFADAEASEEFEPRPDSVVQCNAKCAFNKNSICSANEISVSDTIIGTKCKSRTQTK